MLTQELTLVSHLLKNLVERADKDENGEVTIEEILTFPDFEFIEKSFLVVLELSYPHSSLGYLVCFFFSTADQILKEKVGTGVQVSPSCRRGCGREEREALVAMWFTALQVPIASATKDLN